MNKLISIIIPIYNSELYLKYLLESIKIQTYKNIQVLMIDDGSRDNSAKICKKYEKDKRFKYFYKENTGISDTRNYGIDRIKGDFVCFVDSDDILPSNYIEILVKKAYNFKESLICCGINRFSNNIASKKIEKKENDILEGEKKYEVLFNNYAGYIWNKLFSTKIIEQNKLRFNNEIHMCEDMLFVFEYLKYCKNIICTNETSYNYRISPKSLCHTLENEKWFTIYQVYEKIIQSDRKMSNIAKYKFAYMYKFKLCEGKYRIKFNKKMKSRRKTEKYIKEKYHNFKYNFRPYEKIKLFLYWNFNNLFIKKKIQKEVNF